MNVKTRLALLFTVLVACILLGFTWSVYTYSAYQRSKDFFSELQADAIASATIELRSDNLSEASLEPFRRELKEKLPNESVNIFNTDRVSVFHSDDKPGTLNAFEAQEANRLGLYTETRGDTQLVFLPFDDEAVHYVVSVSDADAAGLGNLRRLRLGLIAGLAASLLIVFAAGFWFAERAMAPIKSITSQAEGISAAGLHVRIPEGPQNDELSHLAHAFNAMMNRLEAAFQAQKQFLANASHELRTPLTTLEGQIELALMRTRSESEYRSVLAGVLEDTRRLRSSTNNLLLLARAESGGGDSPDQPQRLDEILLSALEQIRHLHPNRALDLRFINVPDHEDELCVAGNRDLLFSACLNLIENAFRYSPPETLVRIEVHTVGNVFSVKIIDLGMGIDAEDLPHVFRPFFRAERTRSIPGSGIGLTLVQAIVKRHRGQILLRSEPGQGTTVEMRFPTNGNASASFPPEFLPANGTPSQ